MKTKHLILLFFLIFTSLPGLSQAFNCYSPSNIGEVGPAGSVCEGMLIVNRWRLLNATFSGSDAYTTKDGTKYYFGGANGGVFTGQVTNFQNIFLNKVNFNADIGYWDTSRATKFHGLFDGARSFNQDIGSWDVSNVTNFYKLFYNAHAFNQDLNNWDTSRATTMRRTFFKAYAFNGDISSWNVSRVRDMNRMFNEARKFNQDISGWNVSKVNNMTRMFKNAWVFNQDLTQWDVRKIRHVPKVFTNSSNTTWPNSKRPCWGLSSCPTNPLSLSSSSPADDAFDVSTSTTLTLNFSGTVYTTNQGGNILLYKSDGTLVETFNVKDSGNVTISGAQVSLDLSLEDNTNYYIQIDSGALSSSNTNSSSSYYPGIVNNTTLNFSTGSLDTTAPTLTSTTPQDGETNTQYENAVLRLGFSEDIVIGTGNINLYNADDVLVKAYDVSDTSYVSLDDSFSLEVPLVDSNGDSVLSPGTDYYILMDSGIVKDASDNLFAGITSSSTLNFTTSTTYCGCISGTTRRKNGNVLAGVTVKLLNSSGAVVQSVVSDANGFYHFLPDAAGTYTVEFAKLNRRPVVGQASYEGMSLSGTNIKNIEITASCEDITDIDGLLVDPKGVIYDSESRSPVANVTVELLLNGSVIDDSFLDSSGGTASQVTGADGEYSFILKADTATSGTYEIRVTPPTGYRFESTKIPADAVYTPSIGTGFESIQDQSTPPASGDDTTYHLKFAFTFSTTAGQSSQGIINNHIPIDPDDPTLKPDVKAMVESWTNIAIRWPEDNVRSITDRLNWLERNKNSSKQSFQGIQLRHHNEDIDQLLNSKPKSRKSVLTDHISSPSLDKNSAISTTKELALNELTMLRDDELGSINYKFEPIYEEWSMWTAGEIHLGQVDSTSTSSEQDSKDFAISVGFDKKDTENNIIGWSLALGKYKTDIGTQGTKVESNNVSLSGYGTMQLNERFFIQLIAGYSHLDFDTSRKDQLQTLTGSRTADQIFTSITLKNISKSENRRINITPYGNIYAALTEFDQFSESGGSNAITFYDQRLEHTKVSLGLDIDYLYSASDYSIAPYFNFEVSSDLSNSSEAVMRYNNSSTEYTLPLENLSDESLRIGFGFDVMSNDRWNGAFHFSREQSSKSNYRDSLNLNFSYSF